MNASLLFESNGSTGLFEHFASQFKDGPERITVFLKVGEAPHAFVVVIAVETKEVVNLSLTRC